MNASIHWMWLMLMLAVVAAAVPLHKIIHSHFSSHHWTNDVFKYKSTDNIQKCLHISNMFPCSSCWVYRCFVLAFLNHSKTNHKNQFVNISTKKIFRCSFLWIGAFISTYQRHLLATILISFGQFWVSSVFLCTFVFNFTEF